MDMLQKIRYYYAKVKDKLTTAGIIAALTAFFTGHTFTALVVAGVTYFFWRNQDNIDQLIGVK